jgi:hypothetical protein
MNAKLTACALLVFLAACSSGNNNDAGPACPGGTCPVHETCVSGACQCISGWVPCDGGVCTEIQSDPANCGACGVACPSGASCLGGTCQCTAVACPGPDGGEVCSDLTTDDANCGQCDSPCSANEQCVGALCQCPSGYTICPLEDGGAVCTDLGTDPNNCGQCAALCDGGNCTCDVPSQICSPGLGCICSGTLTSCGPNGTDCVDTNSDLQNCGGCDQPCPTGSCTGGICDCNAAPYTKCGSVCTNLSSDVNNCGVCNNDCTAAAVGGNLTGVSCQNGNCACAADAGSGPGAICTSSGVPACVDESTDPGNCGKCGQVCASPTVACTNGNCSCPTPQELCGSSGSQTCVDITSTANSCGSCSYNCATNYATASECNQGHCVCTDLQTLCLTQLSPALSCTCEQADGGTAVCKQPTLTFADVATILNDTTAPLGCAAAGCHSAAAKAGGLDLSSAQAAYAGLVGLPDAGPNTTVGCDGGPNGTAGNIPSQACPCVARVVPGIPTSSYLIDALTDSSALCPGAAPMPIDVDGGFHPLSACQVQLLSIWIKQGAVGP